MSAGRMVIALALGALLAPAAWAQVPGHFAVGPIVWTGDTDLAVESATDWDGTSRTAEESAHAWNALGSGMGGRLAYEFPKLISVYGEIGLVQTTVQSRDLADLDQTSRGLDAGTFFGAGARLAGDIPGSRTMFWSAGVGLRRESSKLETDPTQRWSYDETNLAMDGRIGARLSQVGLYGGLRLVQQDGELEQTNLANPPGLQSRTTKLDRDDQVDLLVGLQTGMGNLSGFAELSLLGTTSATAGAMFRF